MGKSDSYLPGLNGLRFFAALAVIITHLELIKQFSGLDSFWQTPAGKELGPLGVVFFFVLSGFLITYLLLKEKQKFGKISFKKFYLRRVLRIFPLYYLAVFLAFFVFFHWDFIYMRYQHPVAEANYWDYFIMYMALVPNLTLSFFGSSFPHFGQLWSIGVEEHFYIMWPFLLSISGSKPLRTMVVFLIAVLLIKVFTWLYLQAGDPGHGTVVFIRHLMASEKLESMAIGGITAYFFLHFRDRFLLRFRYFAITPVAISVVFFGMYCAPDLLSDGMHVVYSAAFMAIILNVIANPAWKRLMEWKPLNYFGQVSYGIYVYHLVIVTVVCKLLSLLELPFLGFNVLYYTSSIMLTLFVSHLSFRYFEQPFLTLKDRFKMIN